MVWWHVKWITWRQSEVCVQPWCNPLWLTGLKAPTNWLTNEPWHSSAGVSDSARESGFAPCLTRAQRCTLSSSLAKIKWTECLGPQTRTKLISVSCASGRARKRTPGSWKHKNNNLGLYTFSLRIQPKTNTCTSLRDILFYKLNTGSISVSKYYIFSVSDVFHRPPYILKRKIPKKLQQWLSKGTYLAEFKGKFPDIFFTMCR